MLKRWNPNSELEKIMVAKNFTKDKSIRMEIIPRKFTGEDQATSEKDN